MTDHILKNHRINALILAAGSGKRFGGAKVFAKVGNQYFCQKIHQVLSSLNIPATWIINSEEHISKLSKLLKTDQISCCLNPVENGDMFSSIRYGAACHQFHSQTKAHLEYFPDYFLIWPVDFPLVSTKTIKALLQSHALADLIQPGFNNKNGHPFLISRRKVTQTLTFNPENGMREFFSYSPPLRLTIEVSDPNIHSNINHKKDLPLSFPS
ncbi:MAG: NTP transferase domain-containing protein [Deltaproteobacteria bacterium]|nr:NTP transferase domain-containing protein [Deltaproteobacteria bacterium]